ncbi:unnamed protein product [Eruca vesicaria subsp. sativa]|uniref:Uncharacterized protein n=1 Tax=Eruca vesicaria subsp. sativa TaxID=29727 RepID=A0ABC8J991_ERUVS|nr:unnamed protein product [Eruca vesicaria subsp. sativa]
MVWDSYLQAPKEEYFILYFSSYTSNVSVVCNCESVEVLIGFWYKATIGADFVTKELQIDDMLITLRFLVFVSVCALNLGHCWARKASLWDPTAFQFILLGNKVDIDGGNSQVVSEKKAREWCAQKGTYSIRRHRQKKITMGFKSLVQSLSKEEDVLAEEKHLS